MGHKTRTGEELERFSSRCGYKIEPFQRQDGWVTQQQAAAELKVSDTVIKRLIREQVLPATQVVQYAKWVIDRMDVELPSVQARAQAVQCGLDCRRLCLAKGNCL